MNRVTPQASPASAAPPSRSLAQDTVWLGCAKTFTLALSFVAVTLLLPRCMRDPRDVGLFRQASLWFTLAVPVVGLSLGDSLSYFVPRCASPADVRGVVTRTLLVLSGLGLVLTLATFLAPAAAAALVGQDAGGDLAALIRTAAPVAWASLVVQALEPVAVARGRVRAFTAYSIGTSFVGSALVVAALLASPTPRCVLEAGVLGMVTAAMAALVFAGACGWLGAGSAPFPLRDQARYALPLWMMGIVGLFGYYTAQWTIARHLSPADFAVFSFGAVELPPLLILSSALLSSLTPRLAGSEAAGRRDETVRLWHASIRHLAIGFFPMLVFFGLTADAFVGLILPPAYRGAAPVFQVYLGVTSVRIFAFHAIYQGTGHTRAFLRATLLYLALNVPLCLLFVRWGGLGPAVANLVATLATNALHVAVVGRFMGLSPGRVLPWGVVGKALLAAVAAAAPVVLAEGGVGEGWVDVARPHLEQALGRRWMYGVHAIRLGAGGALYAAAYVPLVWMCGLLTPEERGGLRAWLRRAAGRSRIP